MYNQELDYVNQEEKKGTTLVLRPSRLVKIGKMESNLERVKEMYELGREDALANLDKIKKFLVCSEKKSKLYFSSCQSRMNLIKQKSVVVCKITEF